MPESIVGLDVGSHAVKLVELERNKWGYRLKSLGMTSAHSFYWNKELVEGLSSLQQCSSLYGLWQSVQSSMAKSIKDLFTKYNISNTNVAISLSELFGVVNKNVFYRRSNSIEEIANKIERDAEILFDLKDMSISFHVPNSPELDELSEKIKCRLIGVKKHILENYKNLIISSGLAPVFIDTDMFAWKNVIDINYDLASKPGFNVFMDIGAAILKMYAFDNKGNIMLQRVEHKPRRSKLIMGGYQITKVLQKKFEMSYDEAEAVKNRECKRLKPETLEKIIYDVVVDWSKSILRTLEFLKTTYPHEKINHVFLCGGSSKLPGIDTTLSKLLRLPIETFNPFNRIDYGPFKNDPEYVESVSPHMAIAVGLAVRSFENAPWRNFY